MGRSHRERRTMRTRRKRGVDWKVSSNARKYSVCYRPLCVAWLAFLLCGTEETGGGNVGAASRKKNRKQVWRTSENIGRKKMYVIVALSVQPHLCVHCPERQGQEKKNENYHAAGIEEWRRWESPAATRAAFILFHDGEESMSLPYVRREPFLCYILSLSMRLFFGGALGFCSAQVLEHCAKVFLLARPLLSWHNRPQLLLEVNTSTFFFCGALHLVCHAHLRSLPPSLLRWLVWKKTRLSTPF